MQVIENDGTTRVLEGWEMEALQAARDAHRAECEADGVFEQYDDSTALRELVGVMVNSIEVPDEKAVRMIAFYPPWREGESYSEGEKVSHEQRLWKVLQAHTSQEGWEPPNAPSLFAKVLPGQDGEVGEWVQPGSTNPYMQGDRVTYQGRTYESTIDNNVYSPADFPQGWQEV